MTGWKSMLWLGCLLAGAAAAASAADTDAETPAGWYRAGKQAVEAAVATAPVTGVARNVILFIGDGMGITTVTASRIHAGQRRGGTGEEHVLSFERFTNVALIKTYNTNMQVPDSAGTMSAIMTGIKTQDGVISVDQDIQRGNCESAAGHGVGTLLEQFEEAGRATGIVTTARITHATPAATYAHAPERDWESDADMPPAALAAGCRDIARQMVEFAHGDGMDVVFGGGRREFMPVTQVDPEYPGQHGRRQDGRDLLAEWRARYPDATYLWNARDFATLDPVRTGRALALFEPSHLQYETDRSRDAAGEPSLAEMTSKAIRILSRNPNGYFLMVEGGRIDHALHGVNAYRALADTDAFAQAVESATALTSEDDTLILVTADHSHVMSLGGYPTRGNPILGLVVENGSDGRPQGHPALASDGKPYTTLRFADGPSAAQPRRDLRTVDTLAPDFQQDAQVPLEWETHGGEDVAAYARGPWAHLLRGVQEQNYLYHLMAYAAGLAR